mgnify:CR=1 FL=1
MGIPNRNKKGFKDKWTKIDMHKQSALVDQIVDYTNANGWSQISGGEHDKKWVNPVYRMTSCLRGFNNSWKQSLRRLCAMSTM